ncbi:MAG: LOG family protein, partial [Leptospiraceae bacterium]|nr:LOG family protein [Leptospiraceae bacterium]
PGIMEAGNRGAKEAGGVSLGYSTYFGSGNEPLNPYTTDGYVFASFAQREAEMVDRAAGILIAQGGVGTEWEIYETIAKIQTGKKNRVPVVVLGPRAKWQSLFDRLNFMVGNGTVSPEDPKLLQLAETPEKAIELMEAGMPAE